MWSQQKTFENKFQFRLCFMVSQRRKNTSRQIQENMVWSIQGIIMLT
jgi:hypothetical protein